MNSAPAASPSVPATEFDRFLTTLPEPLRDECRTRLAGSGLSPNHPLFTVMADFYEKNVVKEPAPDFFQEALLHSNASKQLLADFRDLPESILARLDAQLKGLLAAFTAPVEELEQTAADLSRNVEALPILLLPKRAISTPPPSGFWKRFRWRMGCAVETARTMLSDRCAWLVTGSVCAVGAIIVTAIVLSCGAYHLSRYYDQAYRDRISHLEADSLENTIALNRLVAAGITLKVERDKDGDAYYLILQGAHKAAQPVNSPEGLAVEVWP